MLTEDVPRTSIMSVDINVKNDSPAADSIVHLLQSRPECGITGMLLKYLHKIKTFSSRVQKEAISAFLKEY